MSETPLNTKKILSRDPYKGTRDFYPEDYARLNWLFTKMRKTCQSYGYVEYGASPLEATELYAAKSGEEIVNEQTYSFIDRGGRNVTLRPEMTPTVARMVAKRRRELPFPLRWFSIPNLFRYEQPQKGRLREHFQLNVDLFGVKGIEGETEVITLGASLLKNLGATPHDFKILISNRSFFNALTTHLGLEERVAQKLGKLIDRKAKISPEDFRGTLSELVPNDFAIVRETLNSSSINECQKLWSGAPTVLVALSDVENLLTNLSEAGVENAVFDPTLMRGFDYYTGIVFEFFDTNKANSRSLFGGGRYDELLDIFDEEKVPAIGFGMGDVTAIDFLEAHDLLVDLPSTTEIYITNPGDVASTALQKLAENLREKGLTVAIDYTTKSVGDQLKNAAKQAIPFGILFKDNVLLIRALATREEISCGALERCDYTKLLKFVHPLL